MRLSRFLTRLLGWLAVWFLAAPLLLLFVLFAISNRQDVTLGLWPLPAAVTLPLYLLLLGLLFGALLLGLFLGWLGQHGARAENRHNRREIAKLRGMIASGPAATADPATTTLITARTVPSIPTPAQAVPGESPIQG